MTNVHEPVWRNGFVLTRQHWQRFDRINAHPAIHGSLVVIQGGQSFAAASGTTHRLLGVADYRRWNLTNEQANIVMRFGRDLMGTCHERTAWQGFDPHFHDCTIGDDVSGVMDPLAIQQVASYKAGGDGVSGTSGDWQPYRPSPITNYRYIDIEEDDMTPEEHRMLAEVHEKLFQFAGAEFERDVEEVKRDLAEAERDKRRFEEVEAALAKTADSLTVAINKISDRATKAQLTNVKNDILIALAANKNVVGKNDPDPEQL